jgi:hypothetical protein
MMLQSNTTGIRAGKKFPIASGTLPHYESPLSSFGTDLMLLRRALLVGPRPDFRPLSSSDFPKSDTSRHCATALQDLDLRRAQRDIGRSHNQYTDPR